MKTSNAPKKRDRTAPALVIFMTNFRNERAA